MSFFVKVSCLACVPVFLALPLVAAPKIDKETCAQLRSEQATFIQSGILADIQRGPEWAKANLAAERIREIELFITLDEQIKFGCREVTLTGDALRAGEAARRLEINPNADPTAPPPAAAKDGEDASAPAAISEPQSTQAVDNPAGAAEPDTAPAVKPKPVQRPQPAPKPKANDAKANDAYVPPAGAGAGRAPVTIEGSNDASTP